MYVYILWTRPLQGVGGSAANLARANSTYERTQRRQLDRETRNPQLEKENESCLTLIVVVVVVVVQLC